MNDPRSAKNRGYIPKATYERIERCLPIVSVDAVIVLDGSLLLMKRSNKPAKGEWWLPGGRIMIGESPEEALVREVKEETGLDVISSRFINVYSRVFPERHDITIAYLCRCKEGKVKLNGEHSEYGLFKKTPAGLHPFLVQTLRDSKWNDEA
jgi:ADP-ribose pyrophosphatase YjhB (NUDIX family)